MKQYKIDPELEKCLPPLPDAQYQKLRESIKKKYDPAKPIVLWKEHPDTIVDGHHRYKICQEFGIEPTYVEESFESLDAALLYTLQRQVEQRNLTAAQLVNVYERMLSIEDKQKLERDAKENLKTNVANRYQSLPSESGAEGMLSREVAQRIAEKAHTNARTVYQVHAVQKKGVPEIVKMVESGEIGSGYANDFVQRLPKETQTKVIKSGGVEAVKDIARDFRREREAKKRALDKAEKEAEELRKFNEFNKVVAEKTAVANAKIDRVFGANGDACLMPNVAQKWCNDCKWGFDIYLPAPNPPCCPYCKGDNLSKRDDDWNPREVI